MPLPRAVFKAAVLPVASEGLRTERDGRQARGDKANANGAWRKKKTDDDPRVTHEDACGD